MKIVGKIFVVLTFLMSLVLLAFAISISSWEPHWREIAERPRTEVGPGNPLGLVHQLADVKAAVSQQQSRSTQLRDEFQRIELENLNSPYRRQLQSLQAQVDELQAENDPREQELNRLSTEVRVSAAQIGSMQRNLTKRVAEMDRLLAELRGQLELSEEQSHRFVASHDTLQIQAAIIHEGEEHFLATTERVARGRTALVAHGVDPDSPPEGLAPRVRGVITSLGTRDLIELSIGEDDGLRAGHTVELYRGYKYLGRAEVVRTAADKSVAKILKQYQKALLQKGDLVATRLKIG
jgi:hypothetical protein